jgi:hypothetical protein
MCSEGVNWIQLAHCMVHSKRREEGNGISAPTSDKGFLEQLCGYVSEISWFTCLSEEPRKLYAELSLYHLVEY